MKTDRRRPVTTGGPKATALALAFLFGLGLSLTGPLASAGTASGPDMRYFRIGTGTTDGTYFAIGGLIANALSSPPGAQPCADGGSCGVPGLIALAQATSGGIENLELLRTGALEAALVQANLARLAETGQGPYAGRPPFPGLRTVATLYLETVQIAVRADGPIHTLADLKGQTVSVGEPDSAMATDSRLILGGLGLPETSYRPVFLRPGSSVDQLVDGKIDALFIVGGAPFAAFDDAAGRVPIRLVPIPAESARAWLAGQPLFTATVVPAGTYPGVAETATLGVPAVLTVRADLDEALAHSLTRALWHPSTRTALEQGFPRGHFLPMTASTGQTSPALHPGAARFYQEAAAARLAPGAGHQGFALGPPKADDVWQP